MADQPFLYNDVAINFPHESAPEAATKVDESPPPPYEYPQIDFRDGWRDCGFAIVFWLHLIAVISVGCVLGIPIVLPYIKHKIINKENWTSFDPNIKIFIHALGGAAITGILMSSAIFLLLERCASRIIKCSLAIMVIIEILVCAFLVCMQMWVACIVPSIILILTLCYVYTIGKRIAFAEAHLRISCIIIQSRPSLMLVALLMLLIQFLWLVFWCLMSLGILHAGNIFLLNVNNNTIKTTNVTPTTTFIINNSKPTLFNKTSYTTDRITHQINEVPYQYDIESKSSYRSRHSDVNITTKIILFFLLLSWYWGTITLTNVVHFITACTVGRWWFSDAVGEQYTMGTSVKRAFTTNFGTICLGSLLEALIKVLRSFAKSKKRDIIARCVEFILGLIEKIIGYINEWAFIYAALTGQSFAEASRSFIQLFQKRGWTMILNDTIVETCLRIVNIVVGLVSGIVGGLTVHILIWDSSKAITTIIIISIISFLIGFFSSVIITTMLTSCVHTIFACFALNPAALGATHANHLQSLSNVWHQFYPEEYATSGYQKYSPNAAVESYV